MIFGGSMHKQMIGVIPNSGKIYFCEIFGYSSRGVPGLEIVGLGGRGKNIKEKFIYFNKCYGLSLPPLRFVLCVEDNFVTSNKEALYRWLELPFLIMYWSMANILPIQNLGNCLSSGQISATGDFILPDPDIFCREEMMSLLDDGHRLISHPIPGFSKEILPLDEILVLPKKIAL